MAKKSVQEQLDKFLTDFVGEEQEIIENTINSVAKMTKKKLVAISPRAHGDYARGWSITRPSKRAKGATFGKIGITIYNKKHYRLTHLLERSHRIKNQYGEYGRSKPQPHISVAEEWGANELMAELEKKL